MRRIAARNRGPAGRDALRHVTFTRWVWGAAAISMAGGGIVSLFLAFAAPILLSPDATDRLLLRGVPRSLCS